MPTHKSNLGKSVAARRHELGLTRTQVHQRGGPSDTRLRAIEKGGGPPLRKSTLAKLDDALRWRPGSAKSLLAGGEPTPLPEYPTTGAPYGAGALGKGGIAVSNADVADIIATLRNLDLQFRQLRNPAIADPTFMNSYREHSATLSTIVGNWVTNILELNFNEARHLPPVLESALDPFLEADMAYDRTDVSEQRYRRWLAGRDVPVNAAQSEEFRTRVARRQAAQSSSNSGPITPSTELPSVGERFTVAFALVHAEADDVATAAVSSLAGTGDALITASHIDALQDGDLDKVPAEVLDTVIASLGLPADALTGDDPEIVIPFWESLRALKELQSTAPGMLQLRASSSLSSQARADLVALLRPTRKPRE